MFIQSILLSLMSGGWEGDHDKIQRFIFNQIGETERKKEKNQGSEQKQISTVHPLYFWQGKKGRSAVFKISHFPLTALIWRSTQTNTTSSNTPLSAELRSGEK